MVPSESESIHPQPLSYHFSLKQLKTNRPYKVTCTLYNNDDTDTHLLFEPHLLVSTHYGNIMLNKQLLSNHIGVVHRGENTFTFFLLVTAKDPEQYNRFTLSSIEDTGYQVEACKAIPQIIQPSENKGINAIPSLASFIARNNTNYKVHLGVGNYIQSPYTIQPKDWRWVWVSSDNQNIHINKIETVS